MRLLLLFLFVGGCAEAEASRGRNRSRGAVYNQPVVSSAEEAGATLESGFSDWVFLLSGEDAGASSWVDTEASLSLGVVGDPTLDGTTTGVTVSDARTNKAVVFDNNDGYSDNDEFPGIADDNGVHIRLLVRFDTSITSGDRILDITGWNNTGRHHLYQVSNNRLNYIFTDPVSGIQTQVLSSTSFASTGWALFDLIQTDNGTTTGNTATMYYNGATVQQNLSFNPSALTSGGDVILGGTLGFVGAVVFVGVRPNSPVMTKEKHDADLASLGLE